MTRKVVQNTIPSSHILGGSGHETSDKQTRPSPSIFAYCKRSKIGQWEGLGVLFLYLNIKESKHVTMVMASNLIAQVENFVGAKFHDTWASHENNEN